jgi:hypothetical protein
MRADREEDKEVYRRAVLRQCVSTRSGYER